MNTDFTPNHEGITLDRTLSLLDITMIGVGAMIGAGIFVLTGLAAGEAGPALVLAFLLNGIVTTFTALSYAELGSAFPEAGGGYLWVKVGLGGTQGFLAGWMSWFAHAVACSLYGLGFGRFAVEVISLGFPGVQAYTQPLTLIFMTIIVALFAFINYRGASETGLIGNIVTIAKVIILGIFIILGFRAMILNPNLNVFTDNFLPNGLGGVFVAMGLTFIAFEGYEIIAQSGEEVKDPMRNIPRAIFISIAIVVVIYVLVAIVVIGAVHVPPAAGNIPVWEYLAQAREVAIVRAAEQFMGRWGGILILISGLASTMSALNATIYSSSRVSFAMGRDHNLPSIFGRIHPLMHTPYWAIVLSAVLIIVMALSLPIEDVAKSADVMFLIMFAQVNIALMTLRQRRPDMERGFRVPWFPWPPIIGIITNLALAGFLIIDTGRVGIVTVLWLGVGLFLYWGYFKNKEEMRRPKEILHEETLVSLNYSVLVPVADEAHATELGWLAALLAKDRDGDVLALHVVKVPATLQLSDGRYILKERRPILNKVISEAKKLDVPVHTMLRLGRSVSDAVKKTVAENSSDLILFGWPGESGTHGRLFGSVIDPVVANPPADVIVVRTNPIDKLNRILVPVAGGPNGRLALITAVSLARSTPEPTQIILLHVALSGSDPLRAQAQAEKAFRRTLNGITYDHLEKRVTPADSPRQSILAAAEACDLIVIGATRERLLHNLLLGNVAQQVAEQARCPVLIVKRRSTAVAAMLRETGLTPVRQSTNLPD